jgi:hypothetical protein
MKNAKFWLIQIAMVAIISLIAGSPVLAGPSQAAMDNANDNASFLIGNSNTSANSGGGNAGGGNAGGKGGGNDSGGDGEVEPSCSEATGADACTNAVDCFEVFGGIWDDFNSTCGTY